MAPPPPPHKHLNPHKWEEEMEDRRDRRSQEDKCHPLMLLPGAARKLGVSCGGGEAGLEDGAGGLL